MSSSERSFSIRHLLGCMLTLVLIVTGSGFVGMYFWSAVFERLGDPDQSLLFWYLPLLMVGLLLLLVAWRLWPLTIAKKDKT